MSLVVANDNNPGVDTYNDEETYRAKGIFWGL